MSVSLTVSSSLVRAESKYTLLRGTHHESSDTAIVSVRSFVLRDVFAARASCVAQRLAVI